eukprot:m.307180 g.307180  ORF g.307180 m.307180 type:complete len:235 (-) comp55312_c0_seq7:306-1010(-)
MLVRSMNGSPSGCHFASFLAGVKLKNVSDNTGVYALAVHDQGTEFVSVGDDKTLRIWSAEDYSCLGTIPLSAGAQSLAFSITSRYLFVGIRGRPCVAVNLATRTVVRSYQAHKQSQVFGIACSGLPRTYAMVKPAVSEAQRQLVEVAAAAAAQAESIEALSSPLQILRLDGEVSTLPPPTELAEDSRVVELQSAAGATTQQQQPQPIVHSDAPVTAATTSLPTVALELDLSFLE